MSCEICGRSSCTRSFHSFEEQERHDDPEKYWSDIAQELEFELEKLRAENVRLRDAIELYIEYKNGDEAMQEYFGLQNLKKALEGK